jgi:hypothetical protein
MRSGRSARSLPAAAGTAAASIQAYLGAGHARVGVPNRASGLVKGGTLCPSWTRFAEPPQGASFSPYRSVQLNIGVSRPIGGCNRALAASCPAPSHPEITHPCIRARSIAIEHPQRSHDKRGSQTCGCESPNRCQGTQDEDDCLGPHPLGRRCSHVHRVAGLCALVGTASQDLVTHIPLWIAVGRRGMWLALPSA